jgi:hypothetical protein
MDMLEIIPSDNIGMGNIRASVYIHSALSFTFLAVRIVMLAFAISFRLLRICLFFHIIVSIGNNSNSSSTCSSFDSNSTCVCVFRQI